MSGRCGGRIRGKGSVNQHTNLILCPIVLDWRERTARSHQRPPLRPFDQVLWIRFMQSCWVTQREDDGPLNMLSHFPHHLFSEGFRPC